MDSGRKDNKNKFRIFGKIIPIWILLAVPIVTGSLAISIQEVDNILINHLDNNMGQAALIVSDISSENVISGSSIDIQCPPNAEVCAQSSDPSDNKNYGDASSVMSIKESEASAIAAIANSVVTVEQKPVTRLELPAGLDRNDAWFGIENDSNHPQLFLIKAEATPDLPFAINSNSRGASIMYHQMGDDRWLVEIKPGGGTLVIEKPRGSLSDNSDVLPFAIQIEVERELALDQRNRNVLSDPVMVFGPNEVSITSKDRVTTSFEVIESGSTHLIWGIKNNSPDPHVYLVRLDTVPELWINLEILERSIDRVYQRTDEGFFFVQVDPGDIGMSFSAVSGPENYTIKVEVTELI